MRKFLFAGAAAVFAAATPALATTDNAGYVGVEGGILFPKSQTIAGSVDFTNTVPADITRTNVANLKYKKGLDLDFVGGYDFGMFRLEGELGYKRAKADRLQINNTFVTSLNGGAGTTYTTDTDFNIDGSTKVYSGMVNALLDLGGNGGIGGYAGGGVGYASVKNFGESKGGLAWQLIAGVYMPVSSNVDIGLKYRYFRAKGNNGSNDFAFTGTGTCGPTGATYPCSGGTASFYNDSKFSSNSLLASLVYNFGAAAVAAPLPPPPPPPPPAAAPATQTCPDGSVILATDVCPAPPPPPPPPAPVERGERGR